MTTEKRFRRRKVPCLSVNRVSLTRFFSVLLVFFSCLTTGYEAHAQIDVSKVTGTTAGDAGIVSTGGSSYSIPIVVPPGTNLLQPQISLNYSSQAGPGICGYGWNIGGLSSITRSGKTYFYNGQSTSVNFSPSNDAFVLDGQRLFPITGSNGDNGTVYGAEQESFSKIESFNSIGSLGPEWFKVTLKDGTIMEYGRTPDAVQWGHNDSDLHLAWYLNKIIDKNGNYIIFRYNTWSSLFSVILSEIVYTGNDNTGLAPYNKIKFNYVNRPDPNTNWLSGYPVYSYAQLSSVVVTAGVDAFKTYTLGYKTLRNQPYLITITESGADGKALNPTKFDYGNNVAADNIKVLPPYTFLPSQDCLTGDFDGDGQTDILTAQYAYDGNGYKYHKGYRIFRKFGAFGSIGTVSSIYPYDITTTNTELVGVNAAHYYNFMAQDYDGDGKDDVALLQTSVEGTGTTARRVFNQLQINHTRIYVPSSGWTYFAKTYSTRPKILGYSAECKYINQAGNFFLPGDFDGDGKQDYILMLGINKDDSYGAFFSSPQKGVQNAEIAGFGVGTGSGSFYATTIASADNIIPADIDGDGKTELLVIKGTTTYVVSVFPVAPSSGYLYAATTMFTTTDIQKGYRIFPGDFNGDGKADFLIRKTATTNGEWSILIGTGTYFTRQNIGLLYTPILPGDGTYTSAHNIMIGDLNNDGKSDIIHCLDRSANTSSYAVYYSTGDGFYTEDLSANVSVNGENMLSGDFNADGKVDAVSMKGNTGQIISVRPYQDDRLLTKITNGLGLVTNITYKLLSDESPSDFYQRSIEYEYADINERSGGSHLYSKPYNVFKASIYVVSSITKPNGIGGTEEKRFRYQDAVIARNGKGFLGFKKVMVDNSATQMTVTTENEFDPQFYVAYNVRQTQSLGSTLVNELRTTTTFLKPSTSSFDKRYVQQVANVTSINHLNGTAKYATNTFDAYDNVTVNVTQEGAWSGSAVTPVNTTTTTTTYSPHNTPVPVLPDETTETFLRQGGTAVSKKRTHTYNATGQPLTVTEFSGTAKAVTTTFAHNAFGNITQKDIVATGLTTQTEKFTYDNAGRYVTKKEWVAGSLSRFEVINPDPKWGKPLSYTSIDGLTTTYEYDGMGRLTKTNTPLGFAITQSIAWETGTGVYSVSNTQPGGGSNTKSWFDILGREVRREETGFANGTLVKTTAYDEKGNVSVITGPYYTSESPMTTSIAYDSYSRILRKTISRGVYNYSYQASGGLLKISITDPAAVTTSQTIDATGYVVNSTDNGGPLNYTFDSWGNPLQVSQGSVARITNKYDEYGRQIGLTDVNAGTYTYEYNAYGQLVKQTDPLGRVSTLIYDGFGRVISRTGAEGITTMEYFKDQATGYNNDKIARINGFNGVDQTYDYDALRRVKTSTKTIEGTNYTFQFAYDTYGNLSKITYPSGFAIDRASDRNGLLTAISTGTSTTVFSGTDMNSLGIYSGFTLGNGKTSTVTYDFPAGTPKRSYTAGIQDMNYVFETTTGNLTSRNDAIKGLTESFTYDNLNRLLSTKQDGVVKQTVTYDAGNNMSFGNIMSKTDAGNYTYSSQRVNALNFITNPAGNTAPPVTIPVAQQDITVTGFNKTNTISENGNVLTYTYGPDYERVKSVVTNAGNNVETRIYDANYEKQTLANGTVNEIHYITAGEELRAVMVRTNGVDKIYYVYVDYLGSILTITDNTGAVVLRQNFDAWGRNRNPDNWSYTGMTTPPVWLYRGFTGHEHVSQFSLVNMNGRMYDPVLGRMLSPDVAIPLPYSTQGYNRYGYANNNPLVYVDKDGNCWHIVIGAALGAVINLGMKAVQGKIHNFGDGFAAVVIGAAAGAAGAATGGAALSYFGISATSIAGGAIAGATGTAIASPVNAIGNAIYFGDRDYSLKTFARDVVIGGVAGGILGGAIGYFKTGKVVWFAKAPKTPSVPGNVSDGRKGVPVSDPSGKGTSGNSTVIRLNDGSGNIEVGDMTLQMPDYVDAGGATAKGGTYKLSTSSSSASNIKDGAVMGLGIRERYDALIEAGAAVWRDGGWQKAGLTKIADNSSNLTENFWQAFEEAANNSKSIRFDVTDFIWKPSIDPGATFQEFEKILANPTWLNKTQFFINGAEFKWAGFAEGFIPK